MSEDCIMLKILEIGLEPLVILILGVLTYVWGHKVWQKQKAEENLIRIEQKKYDAKVEAYKAAWSLIVFFSENDSPDNILKRGELDENGNKKFYFRHKQAGIYFDKLQEFFFKQGHGLFLPKEIKSKLFELRSLFYGLCHVAQKQKLEEMAIQNLELYHRIVELRESLIKDLQNALNKLEN